MKFGVRLAKQAGRLTGLTKFDGSLKEDERVGGLRVRLVEKKLHDWAQMVL